MGKDVTCAGNYVFNIPNILDAILPKLSFTEVLSLRLLNRCCAVIGSSYLRRHHEGIFRIKRKLMAPKQALDLVSLITNHKNVDNRLGQGPWSALQVNLGIFSKDLIEIFAAQVGSYFPSFRAFVGRNSMLHEVDLKLALFLSQLAPSLESLCLIGHLSEFGSLAVDTLPVSFPKLRKLEYLSESGICKDFNETICKLAPSLMEMSITKVADFTMPTADDAFKNLNGFQNYWTNSQKLFPVVSYLHLYVHMSSISGLSHFIDLVNIGFPCRKLKLVLVSGLAPTPSYQLSLEELLRNSMTTLTHLQLFILSPVEVSINQLQLPTFGNLMSLKIVMKNEDITQNSTSVFQDFKSDQFPRLKYLSFHDYGGSLNPIKAPILSVTHLSLLISYPNDPQYEEEQILLIQALPNLRSLIASNLSFKVKHCVISNLKNLEILELGESDLFFETPWFGTRQELWHLYTGGAPLPYIRTSDDLNNTSTIHQSHEESPPYFNPLPSLENLKHLKILRILIKSDLELDAIIFMSKEKKFPQLHQLEIALDPRLINFGLIEMLSKYHRQVSYILLEEG